MASETEIANLALSHLGYGKTIASLTERSQEASACNQFFDLSRDATLRDFPWSFATKIATLGLVEEDPNDEWAFSYRYPSDCLKLRRILSGLRNDTHQSRTPYKVAQDDSGLLIFCDTEEADLEYTIRASDPLRYPADFTMALSFRLAAYIAPRLTMGDNFKLRDDMLKFYLYEISRAQATNVNEEQVDLDPEAEWIRARDGIQRDPFETRFTPN